MLLFWQDCDKGLIGPILFCKCWTLRKFTSSNSNHRAKLASGQLAKSTAHLQISNVCEQDEECSLSFLVRWFHLRSKGSRVTAWPHQIRPNWERCLAQQKGNNLKDIKCKWNCHLQTSKNTWPKKINLPLRAETLPPSLVQSGHRSLFL